MPYNTTIFPSLTWEDYHHKINLYFWPFLKPEFDMNSMLKDYTI